MVRAADAPRWWVLDEDHNPIPTDDIAAWGRMFEGKDKGRRAVGKDDIDGVFVSTVFLGMDHGYGDGPPILFETMVFRGHLDERQWRYATWDEAAAGHARVVAAVRNGTDPDEE